MRTVDRACIECGNSFTVQSTVRAQTCSETCKLQRVARKQREWKAENAKRVSDYSLDYYAANSDRIKAYGDQYRAANPDVIRVKKRHHKARRLERDRLTRAAVTQRDLERTLSRLNGCCAYCGDRLTEMHWDHVIPLARGGRSSIGNLLPACPPCNMSKGSKLLTEWRSRQRK